MRWGVLLVCLLYGACVLLSWNAPLRVGLMVSIGPRLRTVQLMFAGPCAGIGVGVADAFDDGTRGLGLTGDIELPWEQDSDAWLEGGFEDGLLDVDHVVTPEARERTRSARRREASEAAVWRRHQEAMERCIGDSSAMNPVLDVYGQVGFAALRASSLLVGILLGVLACLMWRWLAPGHGADNCMKCGYSLDSLSDETCPECGGRT